MEKRGLSFNSISTHILPGVSSHSLTQGALDFLGVRNLCEAW